MITEYYIHRKLQIYGFQYHNLVYKSTIIVLSCQWRPCERYIVIYSLALVIDNPGTRHVLVLCSWCSLVNGSAWQLLGVSIFMTCIQVIFMCNVEIMWIAKLEHVHVRDKHGVPGLNSILQPSFTSASLQPQLYFAYDCVKWRQGPRNRGNCCHWG